MTQTDNLTVSLAPAPEAANGQPGALLERAKQLVVVDKTTHEACRQFTKDVKALALKAAPLP